MPTTLATGTVLASVSVPAGGTKAAPVAAGVGQVVDLGLHYGGDYFVRFTNGATGPTAAAAATLYGSYDGNDWFEVTTVFGDLVSAGPPSGYVVPIDLPVRYVRGDGWGNTGQAVTITIIVSRVTAL
jgi:hypothetical protein